MDTGPAARADTHAIALFRTTQHACPYLVDQTARETVVDPRRVLDPALYEQLLAAGFRRSGDIAYRPDCMACQACVPVRIPLASSVRLPRRHRRNLRDNAAWSLLRADAFTAAHRALYARYLDHRHPDTPMAETPPDDLLANVRGLSSIWDIRDRRQLIGFCVIDHTPGAWSAVYTAFEPDQACHGPGTFAVLAMIDAARRHGASHLYLGYWIAASPAMAYKGGFRPLEQLTDTGWRPVTG